MLDLNYYSLKVHVQMSFKDYTPMISYLSIFDELSVQA